jgi:hypothetical protein
MTTLTEIQDSTQYNFIKRINVTAYYVLLLVSLTMRALVKEDNDVFNCRKLHGVFLVFVYYAYNAFE